VTAPKFGTFIIEQFNVLSKDPNIIQGAIEKSNKASKSTLNPLRKKRKGLEQKLSTVNTKATKFSKVWQAKTNVEFGLYCH
jgi:hypothetical protein